jgi:hypothetical protein
MTFTEYINQVDPKRQCNVRITKDDCYQIYNDYLGKVIVLLINNIFYSYLLPKDCPIYSKTLYIMDEDGNKKSISCFNFVEL